MFAIRALTVQFFFAMLLPACHQVASEQHIRPDSTEVDLNAFANLYQDTLEALAIISLTQFAAAERELSIGHYRFSASHLHEGIVAFRGETSKFRGADAIQVNKRIDKLTRLRRQLKHDEKVQETELHRAIVEALLCQPQVAEIYGRRRQNMQIKKGE